MKSLLFVIILLGMLVFIMGVFLMQMVTDKLREEKDNIEMARDLEYWTELPMACLILFECITGGQDWGNILEPLMDHISPAIGIVFTIYMSFCLLCMLNVVTGVFVESATHSTAEEKDINMVNRLQSFIARGQSVVTWQEFSERLEDAEIQLYLKSVDLDVSEAHGLFQLLDTDDTGVVDAEEFVMGCLRLRGVAKAVDLASLMYEERRWHRQIYTIMCSIDETVADVADSLQTAVARINHEEDEIV
jgi:hypothetical protein